MTIRTITATGLRPSTAKAAEPPVPGTFSPGSDPRFAGTRDGGALGTSLLVLYPVFACVIVLLASLSLAGPALPA